MKLARSASLLTFPAVLLLSSVASAQDSWNQQQPPPTNMSAGGLAPPSTPTSSDDQSQPMPQTEQELAKADREDSGRGLEFFYMNAEIGGEHLGLQTFKANDLVDAGTVKTTQTGLMYGGGLGVRLVFLTLGGRFRLGHFDQWDLWTVNAEVGIHIPLGSVEPYFTLGGGYASMGSFDSNKIGGDLQSEDVDVKGWNVRGGFGIDIYLSNTFSLGANLTGEMLVLTRPGVSAQKLQATGANAKASDIYAADGSSIGSAVSLTAVAGLHF
jgi:hypothetical protein